VGEGSLFARRTGYHADILRPAIARNLPRGWETRLVKMGERTTNAPGALSPEDLVVVKLRAGRLKDLELCRALIRRRLVASSSVRQRLDDTPLAEQEIITVYERLREVCS
jgi:hypothetical protein